MRGTVSSSLGAGPLCLAVVVISMLLLGCAGSLTRTGYEREVAPIGRDVDAALARLGRSDGEPAGPGRVRGVAADLRAAAEQLEQVAPPEEVEDADRALQSGLRRLASALDGLAADLEDAEGLPARRQAWARFADSEPAADAFAQIDAAREAYEDAGYRVLAEPGG